MQSSSKKHPENSSLADFLTSRTPILDVRAPAEFAKGHLPNSFNLPILNDAERHQVGLAYKNDGQAAATQLGHKLVSGETKNSRIMQWQQLLQAQPTAHVMCWRGGQRSQIAQQWLAQTGYRIARVPGGYKACRQFYLAQLDQAALADKSWFVLAGRTGVQKTVLLNTLPNSIDLEGLANHRGSAFGAFITPQPSLASFENHLAAHILGHHHPSLILEDESRMIGRVALPESWHLRMKRTPLVLLEASVEQRVAHIVNEYVDDRLGNGETAESLLSHYRGALARIKRRLGGALHQELDELLGQAFADQIGHDQWVRTLLQRYYDPMYDYQLKGKTERVIFRGAFAEAREFLLTQNR